MRGVSMTVVRRALVCLVLLACSGVSDIFAQVNATVGGRVSDASGALIPGVEVTARNVNTGIINTRVTNETGSYEFPSLQPGTYRLRA
ncbi:MAG: carboxypeptidase regulatory-like domain-containing protein, partial [Acidobacteria bacterium]|nr:carboxypeptidase regulatory-like domain-containing protein [Acidobacteriota bacterium]